MSDGNTKEKRKDEGSREETYARNVSPYREFVGDCGSTVVKVLRYNSEGRWFDSRWCHWSFSLI